MANRVGVLVGLAVLLAANAATQPAALDKAARPETLVKLKTPVKVLKSADRNVIVRDLTPKAFDEGFKYFVGTSSASYSLKTGEVWGATINDGSLPEDWASAGFYTNGIVNTGTTPWRGVTVTAVVEVRSLSGPPAGFCVGYPNSGGYFPSCVSISQPGLQEVTTAAFEMTPNSTFQGSAHVYVRPSRNTPAGFYARIVSIKINL